MSCGIIDVGMTFRVLTFGTPGPAQHGDTEGRRVEAQGAQQLWRFPRTSRSNIELQNLANKETLFRKPSVPNPTWIVPETWPCI